jgi:hypothetical protein
MNKITEEQAFGFGLPKWPQMLVAGDSVTVEQAKEIIFATDTSLTSSWMGGNDRHFEDVFNHMTGYEKFKNDYVDRSNMTEEEKEKDIELSRAKWQAWDAFTQKANFLSTQYVHNSWASCAYIYGPHGWCHPDGKIAFTDNVGKWPSVEDVANDWKAIATRWPFLNVWVTLMSAEQCEDHARPVVTMRVSNGTVEYYEGTTEPIKGVKPRTDFELGLHLGMIGSGRYNREHGLPDEWIEEFAEKIRPLVDEVAAEYKL